MSADTETFYLENMSITELAEDDYQYEEIPADDDASLVEGEEDLAKTVQTVQQQAQDVQLKSQKDVTTPKQSVSHRPEVVDDFLRNYLIKMGMTRTLDCFQVEWYEKLQKGLLQTNRDEFVLDVYSQNQSLDSEVKSLKKELERYKDAANKAKEAMVKLQKERDFHRMHHKRVAQEKNKLINDIKRMKVHYASFEPVMRQLHEKYQSVLRQKLLSTLERDRAVGEVSGLHATLRKLESGRDIQEPVSKGSKQRKLEGLRGPTQKAVQEAREKALEEDVCSFDSAKDPKKQITKRYPKDSEFPLDTRVNPKLAQARRKSQHQLKNGGFHLSNTLNAHDMAVSCLALHPRKVIIVTGSDDRLWKMWAIPSGDIIMTGEGHTDWLADCEFHPSGTKLSTVGGDSTIRIWDFSKGECILTLKGHTQAVWACSWHSCGNFLATCSMDTTSRLWDINSERCRYIMRGHMDSVNSIEFLPYSNTVLTCSADKTLSLWDARQGLCAQTFFGHLHSCNHATFNLRGDTIASCDSYGVLKLWDVRKVSAMLSVDAGPHPGNQLAFDSSGQLLALASNDGTVKILDLTTGQMGSLVGHDDDVQCILFDHKGDYLLSGGSDGTVRLWS